jgi:H+/Cl- antiporter ClcA
MLRWRAVLASAFAAVVFAVVPGIAAAQAPGIEIAGAEYGLDLQGTDFINVSGTGVCAAAGFTVIQVSWTDVNTGATGSGITDTQCVAAGEHIRWTVTTVQGVQGVDPRPGDRLNVTANAGGGISDSDQRVVTLKQFH